MLWCQNEYHAHNDTSGPSATNGSFNVIKGDFVVF